MVAWTDGVLWLLMTPQLVLDYGLMTEAETKPMSTRLGRHATYVTLCCSVNIVSGDICVSKTTVWVRLRTSSCRRTVTIC